MFSFGKKLNMHKSKNLAYNGIKQKQNQNEKEIIEMTKRILTLTLAVMLALGICSAPALAAFNASGWAQPELEKAQNFGLIPDVLKGADLTRPITRIEFAAVSVKLYENLSGKTATPAATNPFTDTNDVDVLKASNIGLTAGTSATTFSPADLLTREQAATMLTRAIKAAYIPGWTLESDGNYKLNFTQPAKFADDAKINTWAKPSVYYANAKGVILGTGSNMFSPADNAARQEAVIIAVRMVEKLKGVMVDYTKSDSSAPPPTPPSGNTTIVGRWSYCGDKSNDWLGSGVRWVDIDTIEYSDTHFMGFEGWEFNNDGTFYHFYMTSGSPTPSRPNGISFYRGNYKVNGDEITFSNVEEKWVVFLKSTAEHSDSYDWKPISPLRDIKSHGINDEGQLGISGYYFSTPDWFYPAN